MLKEFVQYLLELKRPELVEAGGHTYSTRALNRLDVEQEVAAIHIQSLSGLIDYIRSNFDHERSVMIHVESPTQVNVFDSLNDMNDRRTYIKAKALLPTIHFERFMSREAFNIMLQSCFVGNGTKEKVLELIASIVEENSVTQNDDGVTQRVTAKTGVATVGNKTIPNPVNLKPFRTFVEIAQPESDFILRLREGGEVALFQADGGSWELNAMHSIKEYLQTELQDLIEQKKVMIIA
ncbi:hypothetical protein SporoP37_15765 [Sporosarcina sp. P37]|uniref:hypothetical protein n=1 Tax=unclassified Sporosarcina TaxID=2647733 RepID=UPI000A179B53|nr:MULTISPECIES: hypothetical protein [unclassified Sporosarcina]ARK25983.1 hypothetical protein SporoP37_15765 [Sporosarcina sp. P37]PID19353.1 hypothetical protein CSV62_02285 [Sporosarcina sp. P35]